jgi:hypothetical protein
MIKPGVIEIDIGGKAVSVAVAKLKDHSATVGAPQGFASAKLSEQ